MAVFVTAMAASLTPLTPLLVEEISMIGLNFWVKHGEKKNRKAQKVSLHINGV